MRFIRLNFAVSLSPLSPFLLVVQSPHLLLFMDITNTITTSTSSSSSWDIDMPMGNCNHILLDQIQTPYEFLNNPLDHQFHTQLPSPTFPTTTNAQFGNTESDNNHEEEEEEGLGAMKEMMYKIAAMQPVDIDPSTIRKPKRRNVRISDDPQSIAARHRRERISERIRILQRLVPGGTKMDTASMLDEAIRYVKFLKRQVQELQANPPPPPPQTMAHVVGGHPVGPMDWNGVRAVSHALGSTSAMGGLGFGFSGDGPSDHRME